MSIATEILFWALAAFFINGARNNYLARGNVREAYRSWGYPNGFHYVTAFLEFMAAIFLIVPSTRMIGALLASCVMMAAILTLLRAGLRKQALTPSVVLAFSGVGAAVSFATAAS